MYLLRLAFASLRNRLLTAGLTVMTIALSVCLLMAVERIRTEAKASFASTLSGTDLIVGARSGSINLLLYSVFRIGNATNNIRWSSYQALSNNSQVDWTIPLSLGDSHQGYRVLGTDLNYFKHYQFGRKQALRFDKGQPFADVFDVVLGATVAQALNYQLGDNVVLAHGVSSISLVKHADKPFSVVGILKPTGTPIDRTLHISLQGMEAIHADWHNGMPARGHQQISAKQVRQMDLQPQQITAFLIGLKSKVASFALQRQINNYPTEPLMAILPGVALQELWGLMSIAEQALLIVSSFVVATGLIGMLTAILTSLNERRREMAILRSVGARAWQIAFLLVSEAFILTFIGIVVGLGLLYLAILLSQNYLQAQYGLSIGFALPSLYAMCLLGGILIASLIMSIIPAWRAYRQSLTDGLSVKV